MSAPAALGVRRRCLSCASAFYDLHRSPIVCPKCGVEFTVVEYPHRAEPARKYPVARKPVEEEATVLEAEGDEGPTLEREEEDETPAADDDEEGQAAPEDEDDFERT